MATKEENDALQRSKVMEKRHRGLHFMLKKCNLIAIDIQNDLAAVNSSLVQDILLHMKIISNKNKG
jgi:hypothetical protein